MAFNVSGQASSWSSFEWLDNFCNQFWSKHDGKETVAKINKLVTETIPKTVDDFFANADLGGGVAANLTGKLQGFYDLVSIFICIWLTYRAIQYIYGRNNMRVMDFLWDSFFKFFVVIIAIQYTDIITMVQESVTEIREYLESGVSVWSALKIYILNAILCAQVYLGSSSIFGGTWFGGTNEANIFVAIFVDLGIMASLLMMVSTFLRIYVANVITFFLMIITFPLILFLMIFDWFKGSFKQWLQLLLNNLIVIFLFHTVVTAIVAFASKHTVKYMDAVERGESLFLILIFFFLWGFLIQIFCNLISAFAQNITSVSMEGAAGSGITHAIGAMGAGAGAGLGAGMLGARALGAASNAMGVGRAIGAARGAIGRGATSVKDSAINMASNAAKNGMDKLRSKATGN